MTPDDLTDEQLERAFQLTIQTIRDNKLYRSEGWLRELYHDLGGSMKDLAEIAGVSESAILYWMKELDIDRREGYRFDVVNRATYCHHGLGYPKWSAYHRSSSTNEDVLVHRLLAVSKFGFDAVADSIVHHKNGVKWDNRPENIEVMSQSEHATMHGKQRAKEQGWYK